MSIVTTIRMAGLLMVDVFLCMGLRLIKTARCMLLRFTAIAAISIAALAPALAQQVAVVVNGDPITTYDIEQRIKFIQLTTRKAPSRQQVIEELINEKLKIQIGTRYKVNVTDKDVENSYAQMGKGMRLTSQQLTNLLTQGGIDSGTLKQRIRADINWQYIIRGKFQASLQINEKDIISKLEASGEKDATGFEYVLRPILFIVPRGSSQSVIESRRRDAESLRTRFQNCDDGLRLARLLRDVAVREPITKLSADLAPALRKILDDTPVGKLTDPETTANGVELFALCAKNETTIESAAKREARNKLFAEEFQAKATQYLKQLRRSAMIEVK